MHGSLLAQAFVYLAAAVLVVPIAKRLGLGSVLGYLLAGVAIGPFALRPRRRREGQDVMHFAEFGVVMMLFLVGLELQPGAAVAAAPADPRAGRRCRWSVTAGGHRGPSRWRSGQPWRAALAARPHPGDVVDRDRAAEPGREAACCKTPGRAGDASRCCCSRTSRSSRSWRCFPLLAMPARPTGGARRGRPAGLAAGAAGAGGGGGHRGRRAASWCGPLFRFLARTAAARDLHRRGAGPGHRHRAADAGGRPVAGARHVPRRRRAGRQRVPPRARSRHRAVQGPAARAVLHRGRRQHRLSRRSPRPARWSSRAWCWRSMAVKVAGAAGLGRLFGLDRRGAAAAGAVASPQVGEFAFVLFSFADAAPGAATPRSVARWSRWWRCRCC